ncbi:MAG: DUF2723 domain-containing protein [Pseudomonadota bacterium]
MTYLLFLATFLIYLTIVPPSILLPDSPEFVSCALSFGIAHPPGYSFYSLLGRVFTFLPIGNLAWRMNLMSSLFASLTVVAIYVLMTRVLQVTFAKKEIRGEEVRSVLWKARIYKSSSLIVSLIFAFSHSFLPYAINTEVYSINCFLLAITLLFIILYISPEERMGTRNALFVGCEKRQRHLYIISLLTGFLLAFHTVNLIYAAVFACVMVAAARRISDRKGLRIKQLLLATSFFLIGLSILFYLPIRSMTHPFINIGDSATWGDFLKTITGKVYIGELSLFSIPYKERAYNLLYSIKSIVYEYTVPLMIIGLVGIYLLLRRRIGILSIFLLVAIANVLFFANYNLGASRGEAFPCQLFLPLYMVFSVFLSVGLAGIVIWTISNKGWSTVTKLSSLSLILILLLRFPFYQNYEIGDSSEDRYFYEFGKMRIETFEPNSIFLCTNRKNSLFFLWYFNLVENRRLDIDFMLINPFVKTSLERTLKSPKFEQVLKELKGKVFNDTVELRSEIMDSLLRNYFHRAPFYINTREGYIRDEYVRIPEGNIYRIQREPPEVIVTNATIEKKVDAVYDGKMKLIGYNIDKSSARIGDSIKLSLFWQSLQKIDKDYTVSILITDEKGRIVRRRLSDSLLHKPAYGLYPTGMWKTNEIIRDEIDVLIHLGYSPGDFYVNVAVGGEKAEELLPLLSSGKRVDGKFFQLTKIGVLPDY